MHAVRQTMRGTHQTSMKLITLRRTLVAAVVLVAGTIGSAAAVTASAAATPYCGMTWGSLPKVNDTMSPAALGDVRTGRHDCYDRVVFDFNAPASGYHVAYADHVYSQGKGDVLNVAGGAQLSVVLLANAYDFQTGAPTFPHGSGPVANVTGYRTLRDVVYGGTFEGYTTFGVGVRARLPFRVFALTGPGSHSRIVLDIAHRWSS
jgi:hypothetical protein